VYWGGGREGYISLINTDMGLELDNLARCVWRVGIVGGEGQHRGRGWVSNEARQQEL
jgi:hypothetical protein